MVRSQPTQPLIAAWRITRNYPGVQALRGVDFELNAGEVHALLGENGAGKSTLVKILSGFESPTSGEILLEGVQVSHLTPVQALRAGIGAIHQERRLASDMSVWENLLLGDTPARWGFVRRGNSRALARSALDRVGAKLDLRAKVGSLSQAETQLVDIARVLHRKPRVLILDEPTVSLTTDQRVRLFELLRALRAEGTGIIYISHHIEEVIGFADRITVLRDGLVTAEVPAAEASEDLLIRLMVGRDVSRHPRRHAAGDGGGVVLVAEGLSAGKIEDVSLTLRAGEIVGLGGMVGAGRSEVARMLCGIDRPRNGSVSVHGSPIHGTPRSGIRAGVVYIPEDRRVQGLVLLEDVVDNIALARRGLDSELLRGRRKHTAAAQPLIDRLAIRGAGPRTRVATLSGGNQQKVLLARWLRVDADVFVFDEPTQGVDVGAKAEIHDLIRELAAAGKAILVISSDTPELVSLCDRVLVMRGGALVGEVSGDDVNEESVVALAAGTAWSKGAMSGSGK